MSRKVKPVKVGKLTLDGEKIYVQSMLNVPSEDIEGNVRQAAALEKAGCEIVRVSVPNKSAVSLISAIKENISIPLVADIHFDYKLALESAAAGADKIRINPGNIGSMDRVKAVADECARRSVPIRIGVNSGSVEKEILAKYGSPTPQALVESAMGHVRLLEQCDFDDIVVSIKSSNVPTTIEAYRLAAQTCDYPLHLGVTEAGMERMGLIKSAVGIGSLLCDGIGETIRVSLTDDPVKEIYAARDILRSIGKGHGVRLVSCPTCGRTKIDLVSLAKRAEEELSRIDSDITVAIMGCAVNGPGEAREADVGVAGGDGCGIIFRKGEILRKVDEDKLLEELMAEVKRITADNIVG